MTCLEVRDRLVERSLGALHIEDVKEVDRHLVWCAACRKEADELDRAAATFALTLAPAAPDPALEDRVLHAVHTVADGGAGRRPLRRGRTAAASVLAAAIALSALGWGVAMAGRAERFRANFARVELQQSANLRQLKEQVGSQVFEARNRAYLGTLAPVSGGIGGGSVLTWISPTIVDFTIVTVAGLPPGDEAALPYQIWIVNETSGQRLPVGVPIRRLNADGGEMRVRNAPDLAAFSTVVVTDSSGEVVLRGAVDAEAAVASPAP